MANGAPTVSNGLIISGVTTVTTLDLNGDLDVDGHTNLDNVSISGISSTGNIYITTGGDGRKLSFAGDGSSHYIKMDHTLNGPIINGYGGIAFETNGTNERLRIDSSGRLVVGSTSAFNNFGFTTSAAIQAVGAYNVGSIASVNNEANGNTCAYTSAKIRGTNAVNNGDVVGSHAFDGYDGGTFRTIARIDGVVSSSVSSNSISGDLAFRTRTGSTQSEVLRITGDGKLTMSSGTVELQSHMVRVGNRTTSQINAGVSTSTGALLLDTTENNLKYYANAEWKTVKQQGNDGSTQNLAARSAKALLDDGITTSGVYWLDMHGAYSAGNAKRHYCLMDTSYDGGGWTLLYSMNHGNNFASGTNYSFALNVGSNPSSVNDFVASNFGYDRRNTFTPQANDQFLIRRSDNNDWRRFVVTTWSPTHNSISDGWSCTQDTQGINRAHPYYAYGQMYDTGGNAVSGMVHFNGCALSGNCATGGGDGDGFGDHVNWSSGYSPYNCWGGAFTGTSNGGSPLYWGQTQLSQGGSLYVQMFYRRTGTQ